MGRGESARGPGLRSPACRDAAAAVAAKLHVESLPRVRKNIYIYNYIYNYIYIYNKIIAARAPSTRAPVASRS